MPRGEVWCGNAASLTKGIPNVRNVNMRLTLIKPSRRQCLLTLLALAAAPIVGYFAWLLYIPVELRPLQGRWRKVSYTCLGVEQSFANAHAVISGRRWFAPGEDALLEVGSEPGTFAILIHRPTRWTVLGISFDRPGWLIGGSRDRVNLAYELDDNHLSLWLLEGHSRRKELATQKTVWERQ